MQVLKGIKPESVMRIFEEMSKIPHGSKNTDAISEYCHEFAKKLGLYCRRDEANNVIIKKAGTEGYENSPAVILQGHIDMVCEKEPDCEKDMAKEGLDLFVEGDMVGARGTTLGADDGIAAAMALAILEADDIAHPPLEVILTTDEEVGMDGAAALDVSDITSRIMLNIDSEDEGIITVSCAGGNVTKCILDVKREKCDYANLLEVTLGGFIGGHSGQQIDKGLGNTDILMGRLLYALKAADIRLVSVDGGLKDNAIPRECKAILAVKDRNAAEKICKKIEGELKKEYCITDPDVFIKISAVQTTALAPMDKESTDRVICLLNCAPNGIQEMSFALPGLVETSLNLGILHTDDDKVEASFCVRSSVMSRKNMISERLACLTQALGGRVEIEGDYPAWEYAENSYLRDTAVSAFADIYGYNPKIEAIHAGLECGLFCGKLPGLDCISYGPDLLDIHTPRERMSISSVERTWNLTLEILKRLK